MRHLITSLLVALLLGGCALERTPIREESYGIRGCVDGKDGGYWMVAAAPGKDHPNAVVLMLTDVLDDPKSARCLVEADSFLHVHGHAGAGREVREAYAAETDARRP